MGEEIADAVIPAIPITITAPPSKGPGVVPVCLERLAEHAS
jgi:hypothetical protein